MPVSSDSDRQTIDLPRAALRAAGFDKRHLFEDHIFARRMIACASHMGAHSFSNLEERLLPSSCGAPEYATVTGTLHLQRSRTRRRCKGRRRVFAVVAQRAAGLEDRARSPQLNNQAADWRMAAS